MNVSKELLERARALRVGQTDAEALLWLLLRGRSLHGCKFRRQHVQGGYILDFYCHEALLAIELDGGGHATPEQMAYDRERSRILAGAGILVLRFWNNEVLIETEAALERIFAELGKRCPILPSPGAARHPLPEGEG